MVVYVGNFDGKTKKEGRPIHVVTLVEVIRDVDDNGEVYVSARSKDFFTNEKLNLEGLVFGDIVACDFQQSAFLGGAPDLVGVRKVQDSPYDFTEVKK